MMSISDQHDADQDPPMMQIQIDGIPIRINRMPISDQYDADQDQHDGNPEKYDANADQHYEISDENNADPQY